MTRFENSVSHGSGSRDRSQPIARSSLRSPRCAAPSHLLRDRGHFSVALTGGKMPDMRLGIAHHFGWAVAVTASADFEVVDRRRIELIEPGLPAAPVHHEGGTHVMHGSGESLDDKGLAALVAQVRACAGRTTALSMDELVGALPAPITTVALRGWPTDFPEDIATLRRPPYESRADSVMYCQVLAEVATQRGWDVRTYDAKSVEAEAAAI